MRLHVSNVKSFRVAVCLDPKISFSHRRLISVNLWIFPRALFFLDSILWHFKTSGTNTSHNVLLTQSLLSLDQFNNTHSTAAAFAPNPSTQSTTALSAEAGRRDFFSKAAVAAAALALPTAANAVVDYENIAYLGGSNIVDVNNANIRAYLKMPGMYPAVAGKIVSHGPYTTVADLYKIEGLTSAQSEIIKKYEGRLVAKTPSPDYVIDRINNGLYR